MKYTYSTSQISKLSLTLCTFSITGLVASLFLILNIIEKYMKELNNVNIINAISPRVLQSKSYLKILGISYFIKNTNLSIILDIIKSVIKSTYILNDIVLTSYSQVIKVLSKSNIVII